jgi:KaiC/GvpD/RAD55 family RecA-like ATPase
MTEAIHDFGVAWGKVDAGPKLESAQHPARKFTHYRPLVEAADTFVAETQQGNRFYLGIDAIDQEMRGISPGHLCLINGFSHSGKTLVAQHAVRRNPDKRVVWFSPDEPRELLLAKLAAAHSGIAAIDLERRVEQNDRDAIRLMRETATEEFPNLIVFDQPLTPTVMEDGLAEAEDVWNSPADLVVIDYVELLQAGETVQSKLDYIKGYGSRHRLPVVALHQTSRSAGAEGRQMTISSGSYGGEQHATHVLGVRRKKYQYMAEIIELEERLRRGVRDLDVVADKLESARHELAIHEYTITVNAVKIKRPGGRLVSEVDMELFTETGRLSPLVPGDLPSQYRRAHARPQWRQGEF